MVTREPRWAVGSNQYKKRPAVSRPEPELLLVEHPDQTQLLETTGISWEPVDVEPIQPSGIDRARARFRAALPELVWNDAALEGNNFTLPEVRTLLDGVTVGGKKLEDEQQVLALGEAYEELDRMVAEGRFRLDYPTMCRLHYLVARHEALESGKFRGEGSATGGGIVRLASGGTATAIGHGENGAELRVRLDSILVTLDQVEDPRERALAFFAAATRNQFFFDGNKRTARLMMAGALMSRGFDAVNVPFVRRLEYNMALDQLFATDDGTALMDLLASCSVR